MKVVLDTNVLISAFVFKGFAAKVFDYCVTQTDVTLSPWIIDELTDKLLNKFELEQTLVNEVRMLLLEKVTVLTPTNEIPQVCRDKDDNHILQIAEFVKADFIITGDKDLLDLEEYNAIPIINPRTFLDQIEIDTK
ncbi:MAG: putative toxin-antitoxin system toxin component, PIN family [Saprospiraceae bacterium]